jgi:hypothetical protein
MIRFDLDMQLELCDVYDRLEERRITVKELTYEMECSEWITVDWHAGPRREWMVAVEDCIRAVLGDKWCAEGVSSVIGGKDSSKPVTVRDKYIQHRYGGRVIWGYDPEHDGYIYFMQCPATNLIAFEATDRDGPRWLEDRSSTPLKLIRTTPGGYADAKRIQERFAGSRDHGDWFRPDAELMAFISTLDAVF